MLHRMAFQSSGKVHAFQLDNSPVKSYLCNQGGTISFFFFPDLPATNWIWLTSMISLQFWHTSLPISLWKLTTFHGKSWSHCDIFFLTYPKELSSFGVNQWWICWLPHILIIVSFITLWSDIYLQELWGWMSSTICGGFRWVIYFFLQN